MKLDNIWRYFNRSEFIVSFYSTMILVTLVFFGLFGIKPVVETIFKKSALIDETDKTIVSLEKNLTELRKAKNSLERAGEVIWFFETYMPNEAGLQKYLQDLYFTSVGSRFALTYVGSKDNGEDTVELSVKAIGNGDTAELVKALEGLKRLTTVKEITVDKTKKNTVVGLELVIYYTREKEL